MPFLCREVSFTYKLHCGSITQGFRVVASYKEHHR